MTGGPSRRELRRQLGPVAWCALEDMAEDAHVDPLGRRVAVTSVRRLAANLGVSKDTAARALLRLRHVGLVEPLAAPRGDTGRFGHATYLVLTSSADAPPPPARPTPTVRSASSARLATQQQPSRFDEAVAEAPETRTAETRTAETRTAETRTAEARTPVARNRDGGDAVGRDAVGRDADDGEAVHTLAPCGAVSSPAGAGDRLAGGERRC